MFTDTHAHLYKEYYEDIESVIKRANENGINKILVAADDLKSCDEVIELGNKYDNVYACLGIFPENYKDSKSKFKKIVESNITNNKFIAIGEIGLDYSNPTDKNKQLALFDYQLSLAEQYKFPVVVHMRDATEDTIETLKKHNVKGVIQCFSGSLETANILTDMGFYFGIGGVMTFTNAKIKNVIKELPLDRIILETDSPFLAPTPLRGQTNEPKNIKIIAEFLADLKGKTLEEIGQITEENVHNLFDI